MAEDNDGFDVELGESSHDDQNFDTELNDTDQQDQLSGLGDSAIEDAVSLFPLLDLNEKFFEYIFWMAHLVSLYIHSGATGKKLRLMQTLLISPLAMFTRCCVHSDYFHLWFHTTKSDLEVSVSNLIAKVPDVHAALDSVLLLVLQELEAIKARVREMEEEAEKIRQMQNEVEKQMKSSSAPALGTMISSQWLMIILVIDRIRH